MIVEIVDSDKVNRFFLFEIQIAPELYTQFLIEVQVIPFKLGDRCRYLLNSERTSELRAKRAAHEVSEAVHYLQNRFVC